MQGRKILALVLAGGEGIRLRPLTAGHPKPALPFAGHRIIDFALSNLVNSGIVAIYVLPQYKPRPILDHIEANWSRTLRALGGFVEVVLPAGGAFLGTADAAYKSLALVERHQPDVVAVFAADHVYRMDVAQMAAFHAGRGAEVTVAALPVPRSTARSFGAIVAAPDGRIESFDERAPAPSHRGDLYASTGNCLFDRGSLFRSLEQSHLLGEADFERHVLQRALRTDRAYAYDFSRNRVPGLMDWEDVCYWRDIGTLDSYLAAQEDALGPQPRFNVENGMWPVNGPRPVSLRQTA